MSVLFLFKRIFPILIILLIACESDKTGNPEPDPGTDPDPMPANLLFPLKGLSINNPRAGEVAKFADFIERELVPMGVNTIVLRVNYQFGFLTIPEVAITWGLSADSARYLDHICKKNGVDIIPHLELFGHQSSGSPNYNPTTLLQAYPEYDECFGKPVSSIYGYRSYCPSNPAVQKITTDMIDEMALAFSSENFHIACDEVMTLGVCDLCKDKTKSNLFANEVNRLCSHVTSKGKVCWMWGDRLINRAEGASFGETLTEWEASANGTYPAVDLIDKSIVVCDWHYKTAPTTHKYFVDKGFDVVQVFYDSEVKMLQMLDNYKSARMSASTANKKKYRGVMGSSWGGSTTSFIDEYMQAKAGTQSSTANGGYVFFKALKKLKSYEDEYAKQ